MKKFFKALIQLAGANLAVAVLSYLIDTLILSATPLNDFGNEALRGLVNDGISLLLFFLIMLLKPLLDHAQIEVGDEEELKKAYKGQVAALLIAYVIYSYLSQFSLLAIIPFLGASYYFYYDIATSYFTLVLIELVVFGALMGVIYALLYFDARRNLREKLAKEFAPKEEQAQEE